MTQCLFLMADSYLRLSVWLSMNTLQPARCMCPHRRAPPAGWSTCDSRLRCRSRSARRAGWRCSLCTSGCYIWGWTRCSQGSRGSFQGRFCPPEVLRCWQEALGRREASLDPGFRAKLDFVKDFCKILLNPLGLLGIISIKLIVIILRYFLYLPHPDKPQIQHVLQWTWAPLNPLVARCTWEENVWSLEKEVNWGVNAGAD